MKEKSPREFRVFNSTRLDESVLECVGNGYDFASARDVARLKVDCSPEGANHNYQLWEHPYTTRTVVAFGRTEKGSRVAVVTSMDCRANEIETIVRMSRKPLPKFDLKGDGPKFLLQALADTSSDDSDCLYLPRSGRGSFMELVKRDGMTSADRTRNVTVIPYENLPCNIMRTRGMTLEQAMEHPITIPIFEGEENARAYITEMARVHGRKLFQIRYGSPDMDWKANARLVTLGNKCNALVSSGYSALTIGNLVGIAR